MRDQLEIEYRLYGRPNAVNNAIVFKKGSNRPSWMKDLTQPLLQFPGLHDIGHVYLDINDPLSDYR